MLHAFVREAHDSIAELFKMLRSILIALNLPQVNGAVKFDNQVTGWTAEVCDELSQWMLPSEFIAVQLMIAQACPQQCFSQGWIVPKFFGPLIDCFCQSKSRPFDGRKMGHTVLNCQVVMIEK